jgi:roadblock/LC7 domain-containing protein
MDQLLNLIREMTMEEKIDQLLQLAAPFFKGAESDAGDFIAYVGPNSRDTTELRFQLVKKESEMSESS